MFACRNAFNDYSCFEVMFVGYIRTSNQTQRLDSKLHTKYNSNHIPQGWQY